MILRCQKFGEFGDDSLVWVGWLEPGTLSTGKLGFNQKTNFYLQEISLLKQQSIEDNRQGKVSLFFYNMDTQVQKMKHTEQLYYSSSVLGFNTSCKV